MTDDVMIKVINDCEQASVIVDMTPIMPKYIHPFQSNCNERRK
jgi:hypothetical protein